jgi:FkbM family methyltransferase
VEPADRDGVDMDVALNAAAKVILRSDASSSAHPVKRKGSLPATATTANRPVRSQASTQRRSVKGGMKQALKSLARPFSARLRSHLNQPVRSDIRRGQASLQSELRLVKRHLRAVRQELAASERRQTELIESLSWQLLQNVLAIKDFGQMIARTEQYSQAAAKRVAVTTAPNEVLVRTAEGYVVCSPRDHALLAILLEAGELEPGTRVLIQRVLEPGNTFVDAGANIGLLSLAASHALAGTGHIIGFEPHPETHRLLTQTMLLNGLGSIAEMHQSAVSSKPGTMPLFLGITSGHHSLHPLDDSTGPVGEPIDVPVLRLDDVISGRPVDLLKIDVEGAELDAIAGAESTIQSNPDIAIIVEFGMSHLHRTGVTTASWLKAFEDFGLRFEAIDPTTGDLLEWPPEKLETVESINLFFARPESPAWDRARGVA